MSLDTAKFIGQLDAASPAPGDAKGQGDDHIRVSKAAARNSFPGFTGVILAAGTDTGVSNTYVLNPATPLQEYSKNMGVLWFPSNTNGGASTITISGLGAVPIKRQDGTATSNGDIMAGQPLLMSWTGTEFRIASVTQQYVNQLVFSGTLPGQAGNAGKPLVTSGTAASFSNAFGVAMDEAKGADIGAAPVLNLTSGAGTGNFVRITGSGVVITSILLPSGAERAMVFDGINTLTNNGSIILPTGANITTAAGDTAIVRGDGSAVRVISYQRANGRALVEQVAPGLVLLASITPIAGVSAIDFQNIFSSQFDDYIIRVADLRMSGSGFGSIQLQLAFNGVFDTDARYDYTQSINSFSAATRNSPVFDTGILVQNYGVSNFSKLQCEIEFRSISGKTQYFKSDGYYSGDATDTSRNILHAIYAGAHENPNITSACTGFRILTTPAILTADGSIQVYGIRKT